MVPYDGCCQKKRSSTQRQTVVDVRVPKLFFQDVSSKKVWWRLHVPLPAARKSKKNLDLGVQWYLLWQKVQAGLSWYRWCELVRKMDGC